MSYYGISMLFSRNPRHPRPSISLRPANIPPSGTARRAHPRNVPRQGSRGDYRNLRFHNFTKIIIFAARK